MKKILLSVTLIIAFIFVSAQPAWDGGLTDNEQAIFARQFADLVMEDGPLNMQDYWDFLSTLLGEGQIVYNYTSLTPQEEIMNPGANLKLTIEPNSLVNPPVKFFNNEGTDACLLIGINNGTAHTIYPEFKYYDYEMICQANPVNNPLQGFVYMNGMPYLINGDRTQEFKDCADIQLGGITYPNAVLAHIVTNYLLTPQVTNEGSESGGPISYTTKEYLILAQEIWYPIVAYFETTEPGADPASWIEFIGLPTQVESAESTPALHCWPNPAADRLNVMVKGYGSLSIKNMSGRVVYSDVINNSKTIDASGLAPGIYVVETTSGGLHSYQRVVFAGSD